MFYYQMGNSLLEGAELGRIGSIVLNVLDLSCLLDMQMTRQLDIPAWTQTWIVLG